MRDRPGPGWAVAAAPPIVAGTVILWGMAVGVAQSDWGRVWPGPFDRLVTWGAIPALALAALGLAAWALACAWRQLAPGETRRSWLWLLAYLSWVFLAIWVFMPVFGKPVLPWLAPVWLVALAPALRRVGRGVMSGVERLAAPSRRFLWLDFLLIGLPCLGALGLSGGPAWAEAQGDLWRALLTYPVYAYFQLLLFLSLPALLLQRLGIADWLIAWSVAAVFALLHWPNPVLAGATGVAMLIWSRQFLQGRRLWSLALVMGLSAAVASTLLPHWLTWEMRIGPGYIGKRIELACSSEPETCTSR